MDQDVGKSTFSRLMSEKLPNSLIVNVDKYMKQRSEELENIIFDNLGIKKEKDVCCCNYYFETFENTKLWLQTIQEVVSNDIKKEIIENGKGKDYIIVDWCFLPLCDYFKCCDLTICVTADFDLRLKRVTERLKDKSIYGVGDYSYWSYKPGIIEKRLKITTLNEYGYKFNYYIQNNGNMEELYNNTDLLAKKIMF